MAREFAKSFYKSAAWRKCRASFFISRHGLCNQCSNPGKIVHHIAYLTPQNIHDPNISLSHENLELLCQTCHNKVHHGSGEGVTVEGTLFDGYGNLVQVGGDRDECKSEA